MADAPDNAASRRKSKGHSTTGTSTTDRRKPRHSTQESVEATPPEKVARITGCILARNESASLGDALDSLKSWTDQLIVLDNESEDDTVEVARRHGADLIVTVPFSADDANFDAARNLAIEHAEGDWLFYLDADERVPSALGPLLRRAVEERSTEFEALALPFRNYFCGRWMQHSNLWPGYKGPQLLKRGYFRYQERLHAGVHVEGRCLLFPADNPELAIVHHAYTDVNHYLRKLNRYTDGEALNLYMDKGSHSWRAQLAHFVHDWVWYYERGEAHKDGMHGFALSFLSGVYRWLARAKLWDLRRKRDEITPDVFGDGAPPKSVAEMIDFMERVYWEGAASWLALPPSPSDSPEETRQVPRSWLENDTDPSEAAGGIGAPLKEKRQRPHAPIAACVVVRDDNLSSLEETLRSLQGLARKIVVTNLSQDQGVEELARRYTSHILTLGREHESAQENLFSLAANSEKTALAREKWLLLLESGEVIPASLARTISRLVVERADAGATSGTEEDGKNGFDALYLPEFTLLYGAHVPGKARAQEAKNPRFARKGTFTLDLTEESAKIQCTSTLTLRLPGSDPDLAIVRHGPDDLHDALAAMTRATDAAAERLYTLSSEISEQGAHISHSWQAQIAAFTQEWMRAFDVAEATRLGAHSSVYAFLEAFSAFLVRARLWDLRRQRGDLRQSAPDQVPSSLAPVFDLMRQIAAPDTVTPGRAKERAHAAPSSASEDRSAAKAIVIQCAVGEHEQLLALTRAHHEAYTKRHHMDYVARFGAQQGERHPHWDKILLLLMALRQGRHEYIFVLDADTLIADVERDLRDAIATLPSTSFLGMVQHGGRPEYPRSRPGAPYYNNGVMYVRSCPEALEFFEEVWSALSQSGHWGDNETLIHVLDTAPERWAGRVAVLDDAWNSTARQNESPAPVVLAWHGFGSTQERLQAMRAALREAQQQRRSPSASAATGTEPSREVSPTTTLPTLFRPRANPVSLDDPIAVVDFRALLGRPLRVRWEGDQTLLASLAHVNREICLGLLDSEDIELSLAEHTTPWHTLNEDTDPRFAALFARRKAALSGPPDVVIRHHFPANWRRPHEGKLVVMQPWELSHLPENSWVAGATYGADAVWVYSRFVRDIFVRSGAPAEKIHLLPAGVRPDVFTPQGDRHSLPTKKSVRFLFVGGTLFRKGADILLAAYQRAFTSKDDVCLIVKDMGTRTFYQAMNLAPVFRNAAEQSARADSPLPEVLYLDEDMSENELASLYRACSCLVAPYRGEGFALPPLEALACGLPAIVTAGGPSDDYLDDTTALRIPHRRRIHRAPNQPGHSIDVVVPDPWDLEPDLETLVAAMRWTYEHPEEAQSRGAAGHTHVLAGWTWERSVQLTRAHLYDLFCPAPSEVTATASPSPFLALPWAGAASDAGSTDSSVQEPQETAETPNSAEQLSVEVETAVSAKAVHSGKQRHRNRKDSTTNGTDDNSSGTEAVELSLCMIARDEEARIGKCLESIRPHVDEMIVVDTGSSDRTREIARDCGARVFEMPWPDSFAAARNASIEPARGKWIFWMDADDVISEECGRGLRELIRRHPDADAAYQVQVRIPPGAGEWGESVVDHVKLFPNRPDLRFEHRIHEQILPALRRAQLPVHPSDLYVTHAHYDRSPEGQRKKRLRDFFLLEKDLRDRPDHPFVLFNLGMTHLFATKDFEVAAQYLIRCLRRSHWQDSIVRKAYALLTTARTCQQDWKLALAANEEGRRFYPNDAELLYQAGQIYQQVGRFAEARTCLENLVGVNVAQPENGNGISLSSSAAGPLQYRSVDMGLRGYKGLHELALLYGRNGDSQRAVDLLEEVLQKWPDYTPARADRDALQAAYSRRGEEIQRNQPDPTSR